MKATGWLVNVLLVGLAATGCAKKPEQSAAAKVEPAETPKTPAAAKTAPPAAAKAVDPGMRQVKAGQSGAVDFVRGIAAGDVALAISDELVQATEAGRKAIVYVGATWCEPCKRFKKAALAGELDGDLKGMRFLEFDADRDGQRLKDAGYTYTFVPFFGMARFDGKAAGPSTAGVPNKDSPMAPLAKRVASLASGETDPAKLAP